MKKALCLLLVLMTLPMICAQAENTEIVLWHCAADEAGTALEGYVSTFNAGIGAEHGITVTCVYQGAYTDATQKMNNMLLAGQYASLPDVMQLDSTGKVNYASSEYSYTVDEMLADDPAFPVSDLLPAALGNWNFAGVQLGLPFAASTTVLYCNQTLLDAYQLSAPDTLDDIAAMANVIPDVILYAELPNTPSLANWLGQMGSMMVDCNNGNDGVATRVVCLENGALERFLTKWQQLWQSGALKNTEGSLDTFTAGQSVLFTASSSKLSSLFTKIGDRFELSVACFPRVDEDAYHGSTVSGSCLVAFDKGDDEKKAAARLLMQYLTGPSVQADWAVQTGYIPVHRDAANEQIFLDLLEEHPQYAVSMQQLFETPSEMRSVTVGPSKDFYYAIENSVTDMLEQDLTAEETAELMTEELDGLLWQYNRANQ